MSAKTKIPLRKRLRNKLVRYLVGDDSVAINLEVHGCLHFRGPFIYIDETLVLQHVHARPIPHEHVAGLGGIHEGKPS